MFEYIEGNIIEKSPAHIVIEAGGVGYFINISVTTYSMLPDAGQKRIFVHQVIRDDAHVLFGFALREERTMFRLLLSVSGIGANTARVILSSLTSQEVAHAILEGDVRTFQSIKGIGLKTAQRIIVDLKDKVGKGSKTDELFIPERNTIREESLSALVALGFIKTQAEKVIGSIMVRNPAFTVEEVVKQALKML
jgi:holliday junction DNA helicase RuvA